MMKVLAWIWCFPQELMGLVVRVVTRARYQMRGYYEYGVKCGSLSLGTYVFLCPSHWGSERVLAHERGHVKQSWRLGWLYLLVVGLPSIIWAGCFRKWREERGVSYYAFWTERWADELGGVKEILERGAEGGADEKGRN